MGTRWAGITRLSDDAHGRGSACRPWHCSLLGGAARQHKCDESIVERDRLALDGGLADPIDEHDMSPACSRWTDRRAAGRSATLLGVGPRSLVRSRGSPSVLAEVRVHAVYTPSVVYTRSWKHDDGNAGPSAEARS